MSTNAGGMLIREEDREFFERELASFVPDFWNNATRLFGCET